jgi:hypothetical protein
VIGTIFSRFPNTPEPKKTGRLLEKRQPGCLSFPEIRGFPSSPHGEFGFFLKLQNFWSRKKTILDDRKNSNFKYVDLLFKSQKRWKKQRDSLGSKSKNYTKLKNKGLKDAGEIYFLYFRIVNQPPQNMWLFFNASGTQGYRKCEFFFLSLYKCHFPKKRNQEETARVPGSCGLRCASRSRRALWHS